MCVCVCVCDIRDKKKIMLPANLLVIFYIYNDDSSKIRVTFGYIIGYIHNFISVSILPTPDATDAGGERKIGESIDPFVAALILSSISRLLNDGAR